MNFLEILGQLLSESGFAALLGANGGEPMWQNGVMIVLSFVLLYMAIVKKFEPLLLLPIAFGIFMSNLPLGGTFEYFYQIDHWYEAGILGVMYMGVKSSFFPCIMFLAVGAMTDFGPLIANPISLLAQPPARLLPPLTAPLLQAGSPTLFQQYRFLLSLASHYTTLFPTWFSQTSPLGPNSPPNLTVSLEWL